MRLYVISKATSSNSTDFGDNSTFWDNSTLFDTNITHFKDNNSSFFDEQFFTDIEKAHHSYHILFFMIIFMGFYGWKIKKNQWDQFSNFRVYHIFMYLAIMATLVMTILMLIYDKINDSIFIILVVYGVVFLKYQHFSMLVLAFLQLFIVFFGFRKERKYMMFGGFFLILVRIGSHNERIILEIFSLTIEFEYLDTVLHTMSNFMLFLIYFRWLYQKFDVDQKRFCVVFQSFLVLLVISITKTFYLLIRILKSDPETPIETFDYKSYVFYLPYLWIISCYISYCFPVLVWVQNQEEFRNSSAPRVTSGLDIPMEPVTQPEISNPTASQRRVSIETTVSFVNVSETDNDNHVVLT